MYKYITHFPSTGNNKSIFSIFEIIVKDFLLNFKPNFFKHVVIDNKTNMKNMYAVNNHDITAMGYNKKGFGKIQKPNLYVEFQRKGNNPEDTHLNTNIETAKKMPGVFGYDLTNMRYPVFYRDPEDITIGFTDLFNRVDFNITVNLATKDDQEDFINKIDLDVNQFTGKTLPNQAVDYMLPKSLINLITDLYYKNDINFTRNNAYLDTSEKNSAISELKDKISAKLITYSNGYINIHRTGNVYHDSVREETYDFTRHIPIYYKFSKFEPGDGEKIGEVYDKYPVTVSGYVEFYNIIGYILNFPQLVNGNETEGLITKSVDRTIEGNYHVNIFHKYYVEEREISLKKPDNWGDFKLFFEENEMVFTDLEDNTIDLRSFLEDPKSELEQVQNNFFLHVFDRFMTVDHKEKYIYIEIHKNTKLLEPVKDYIFNTNNLKIEINKPEIGCYYSLRMYIWESKIIFLDKVYNKGNRLKIKLLR